MCHVQACKFLFGVTSCLVTTRPGLSAVWGWQAVFNATKQDVTIKQPEREIYRLVHVRTRESDLRERVNETESAKLPTDEMMGGYELCLKL